MHKVMLIHKSRLGQFMTPANIAQFMASMFHPRGDGQCQLLDAGAGYGALTCAFLDRCRAGEFKSGKIEATLYEIDESIKSKLTQIIEKYEAGHDIKITLLGEDFISEAVELCMRREQRFTHAILNPPYKKINSNSFYRRSLRRVGIETVNSYSAFVALSLELLQKNGELVAIIPRSFCNGPYFKSFRQFVLKRSSIRRIHLFNARNKAFGDQGVLQENIILMLERGGLQESVLISTSTDHTLNDYKEQIYPFEQIVFEGDSESFIHVPASPIQNRIESFLAISWTLSDLGLEVSTGPVVDFRLRGSLKALPDPHSVPLLYPGHFKGQDVIWPKKGKKPNAILYDDSTKKWLYPSGFYTIVRRFSSKEEKRRIVANVVDPAAFSNPEALGFENHLNVFHSHKRGISELIARGLAVFLNSSVVDQYFRRFSGHTQVNATDLRGMKYPRKEILTELGNWSISQGAMTQEMIDHKLELLLDGHSPENRRSS